jgi:hypothetical protein
MAENTQTDGTYLSLFMFLIITILYFIKLKPGLTLKEFEQPPPGVDEKGKPFPSPMEKFQSNKFWQLITYILLIIVSQYSVNTYVLTKNCTNSLARNMIAALFLTIIPWLLIFGAVVAVLVIFPGFKSAFSNVIGYFVVANKANIILTTLLKNTNIEEKINSEERSEDQKQELEGAAEAILKLCGNTGILINQISPDNFIQYWELLKPLIKNEFKEPGSGEINGEGIKLKGDLLSIVSLRDNVGEALWYTYTAVLLISIVQMNITLKGCQQDPAAMEASRQKYLQDQAAIQENQEKLNSQTYIL